MFGFFLPRRGASLIRDLYCTARKHEKKGNRQQLKPSVVRRPFQMYMYASAYIILLHFLFGGAVAASVFDWPNVIDMRGESYFAVRPPSWQTRGRQVMCSGQH